MGVHWTILASFLQAWGPSKCTYERNGPWADGSPTDETDWEWSHSVLDANVPWKVFPASCCQGAAWLCSAVSQGVGSGSRNRLWTVRTGKSRLLSDGDTIMGCRDIPVGVHGRTPPHPPEDTEKPQRSAIMPVRCPSWDVCGLRDPHLTPPRAALLHSSRSKASVHKSPKHFASLHITIFWAPTVFLSITLGGRYGCYCWCCFSR